LLRRPRPIIRPHRFSPRDGGFPTFTSQIAVRTRQRVIRILVVDDHRLFAQTLSAVLKQKGLDVVGIATNGAEASAIAEREWPDVTLVDLDLRGSDGLTVARGLLRDMPGRRVIALTGGAHEASPRDVADAGLHGFLLKDTSLERLLISIDAVHDGSQVFPPQSANTVQPSWSGGHAHSLAGLLTSREQEILGLLAEALATPRIAERLNLSISTVRTHVQTILGKLEVHSRLEAVAFARLHGIIDSD
jgi:DNA-binding NarL/FixJ family response regulator